MATYKTKSGRRALKEAKKKGQKIIKPQPKQEQFLSSDADICFYGGSAGSGKSFAATLLPLYHYDVEGFNAMIFRRHFTEITTPGGLWDEASKIYPLYHARKLGKPEYRFVFPSGAVVKYSHLEHEDDKFNHHGGQYCLIVFDEITTFSETQFIYLLSRNRSVCGVKPYVRATCNPDAGSWVKQWISWYINPDTGYAIDERSGVIRWFVRSDGNNIVWGDKREDLAEYEKKGIIPKTFTFIFATIDDNKELNRIDPAYKANLMALSKVERERLLKGNWNIRNEDGLFSTQWFTVIDEEEIPKDMELYRYWDRAATIKTSENKDPDYTAGALGGIYNGQLYILDMKHFRGTPAQNASIVKKTAEQDGRQVTIGIEQEPGSAGKDVIDHYKTEVLKEFIVVSDRPSRNKWDRATPWCRMAEEGNVLLVRGAWNRPFLDEVGAYSPLSSFHKDQVDAVSGLFQLIIQHNRIFPTYRRSMYGSFAPPASNAFKYLVMFQESNNTIYGLFMTWNDTSKELVVYDEMSLYNPSITEVMRSINNSSSGHLLYANDRMFRDGESVAYLLQKNGIHISENPRYEEQGAIAVVNDMFLKKQIKINSRCKEMDRQLREWAILNSKPAQHGFGLCRNLCTVVSLLKSKGRIEEPKPPKPYGRSSDRVVDAKKSEFNFSFGKEEKHWLI